MELNFKSVVHLMDYFVSEKTGHEYLAANIWADGQPVCPHCDSTHVWVTKNLNPKKADVPAYRCKACTKKFTTTVGTIFEGSKIPLRLWYATIFLATTAKKGISSLQLSRQIGVTQKTAWFMMQRIREMFQDNNPAMLSGDVEIDETFVGGKYKNMTKKKRESGPDNKTVVLGMVQRNGSIIVKPVASREKDVLLPEILKSVAPGANVYTDELSAYKNLAATHNHEAIQHRFDKYVNGPVHTQTIEGFWSVLKRGIIGVYHFISPKHLHRYCNEFAFRYNSRMDSDSNRFRLSVVACRNKRLRYEDLVR